MSKKRLFKACQRLARGSENQVVAAVVHKKLAEMGYGEIRGRYFIISQVQREAIRSYLKTEFDNDWMSNENPLAQETRLQAAKYSNQEKFNRLPSKSKWVKLLSLDGEVWINKQLIPNLQNIHFEMSTDDLSAIDCTHLLLVENVEAFSAIRDVDVVIPDSTLVVYRGDAQSKSGVNFIQSARKINANIKVGVYADFDPAGFEIALSIFPDFMILPNIHSLSSIKGDKQGHINQFHQIKSTYAEPIKVYTNLLIELKSSYTQERLIAHNIKHEIIWLGDC